MKKTLFAALALTALVATPASAVVVLGNTTGGPTWNRPLSGNPPAPPPSGVGTAVRYQVTQFTVGTSGNYNFLMIGTNPAGWDTYLHLYQTAFNPASQFTNIIIGNDDFPGVGRSGFSNVALTAGTSYFAIASGFANSDFGAYSLEITGPGTITIGGGQGAVPEPSTWAMLIAGFGVIGSALRRRRSVRVSFG